MSRVMLRLTSGSAAVLFLLSALPGLARADEIRDAQWHLKTLRISEVHKISVGVGVVVAVVDSGVSDKHPDLAGVVLAGKNVLGDGGDGRQDIGGHGTAMAGIIASRGRGGGRGLLGIAPGSEILPVRPTDETTLVAKAVDWSIDHGAKVINMSIAVPPSSSLEASIKRAAASDVVLIGSAGNSGDEHNKAEYPANYAEVVAVGAVDRRGKIAEFSQRGPQIDIVAPGVDIPKLKLPDGYAVSTGTSDAAAIVSGAAALIRAKYPTLSATQVAERLTSTAKDLGPKGRDDTYGHGELDIMAALTAKFPTPTPTATPPAVEATAPVLANRSGPPPTAIIGAGLALLLAAGAAAALLRRSRNR